MEKYFELRENGKLLYGVISNIPTNIDDSMIKKRIETETDFCSLKMTENEVIIPDIVMDWQIIDYEQELDKDFIDVADTLYLAINKELEAEVVYTALKEMKKNPELSISEVILKSLKNWVK